MHEVSVFVRIGLYMAAGRLVAGGWLPEEMAGEFTSPAAVEVVTGLVVGAGALVWYGLSTARAALRSWM